MLAKDYKKASLYYLIVAGKIAGGSALIVGL